VQRSSRYPSPSRPASRRRTSALISSGRRTDSLPTGVLVLVLKESNSPRLSTRWGQESPTVARDFSACWRTPRLECLSASTKSGPLVSAGATSKPCANTRDDASQWSPLRRMGVRTW
jgi:hypothetical protein